MLAAGSRTSNLCKKQLPYREIYIVILVHSSVNEPKSHRNKSSARTAAHWAAIYGRNILLFFQLDENVNQHSDNAVLTPYWHLLSAVVTDYTYLL